jgi:hypothetical protein
MTDYIYLSVADNVLTAVPGGLLVVGTADDIPFRVAYPTDPPQLNCAVLLPSDMSLIAAVPVGSYNIEYPYTRTALRVRMTKQAPLQQMGQFCDVRWATTYIVIVVRLFDVNENELKISRLKSRVTPDQIYPCTISSFAISGELFSVLIIDASKIAFPARAYLEIVGPSGQTVEGWIGLRATRDSAPSGSVV